MNTSHSNKKEQQDHLENINKLKQQYENEIKNYKSKYGDSSLTTTKNNDFKNQIQKIEPKDALNKIREIQRRFDREISRFDTMFGNRGFNDWGFHSPFRNFFDNYDINRSMRNMRGSMMSEINDVLDRSDRYNIESWQDGNNFFMKMS